MKTIIISILALVLIIIVLFLFSAIKVSSMCSKLEEMNDTSEIVEGDDDYAGFIERI